MIDIIIHMSYTCISISLSLSIYIYIYIYIGMHTYTHMHRQAFRGLPVRFRLARGPQPSLLIITSDLETNKIEPRSYLITQRPR